ncbi:YqaE/Pmp3 family membrane protein [Persicimonas caeni]|uniref:YqaE/Pmp3 family membrane protein n=1 Tax=Persicimonas caeni TaxID=2292766 RepID=A0A4Y6PMU6_PERCE|nr:YqaE/Pmp3 family membrane protein [Persicimonas caeni]QDG49347.1 YqaE/Pmp3 family membrane protein [Persicimonas caeni]QED30568.1 YqaE/Pmp3 family membrane protein [Persicimonas caeni]
MNKILLIIVTILLPPLGVFLKVGLGNHFWLNLILTILGYIPGIIHGLWIVALDGARPASATS